MQRATRGNADNTLVHVEDPEQIIRVRRRSMAEQAEQGEVNRNPRVTRDSDGEEYSEAEEVNIPDLYVPDLDNTPLRRAIRNGMALNEDQTIYRIRCPKLKEYIGKDTLTVFLPEGRLEVPTEPPIDFVANCASTPFDQPRLLIEAMQSLVQNTTQADHTTRRRHSLGQRQVSIKKWTHRKTIKLCRSLCNVCRERCKTWECTATRRQRWSLKEGNARGNSDAETIKQHGQTVNPHAERHQV